MGLIQWFFGAKLELPGGGFLLWREVVGNVFGLLSAWGGMRRRVWAWPVGIVGNLLLLTVFLGSVFETPQPVNLLGQAGRQILFIVVSVYGWYRWRANSHHLENSAVVPQQASWIVRGMLAVSLVGGTALLSPLFRALGSYEPVWADAWVFMGSLLATYGMARGWIEFWLLWVAVDAVGVPLLVSAGYYASGIMYAFYGLFTLTGFLVWWRSQHSPARPHATRETASAPMPQHELATSSLGSTYAKR